MFRRRICARSLLHEWSCLIILEYNGIILKLRFQFPRTQQLLEGFHCWICLSAVSGSFPFSPWLKIGRDSHFGWFGLLFKIIDRLRHQTGSRRGSEPTYSSIPILVSFGRLRAHAPLEALNMEILQRGSWRDHVVCVLDSGARPRVGHWPRRLLLLEAELLAAG